MKKVNSGLVTKSKVTGKGFLIILAIGVVGGLIAIALNNNVPEVQKLTAPRGFSLFSPSTWFA